jgi:NhaP-type Na+/H+ and K+/H+ antiporter
MAALGTLLLISFLFSRAMERFGVPVALIFLIIGMLAGQRGSVASHSRTTGLPSGSALSRWS